MIEGIIEKSGTPYFSFKDLDENKPSGSIRIRVETIDYFLRRYREDIIKRRKTEEDIEAQLAQFEAQLREPDGAAGGNGRRGLARIGAQERSFAASRARKTCGKIEDA